MKDWWAESYVGWGQILEGEVATERFQQVGRLPNSLDANIEQWKQQQQDKDKYKEGLYREKLPQFELPLPLHLHLHLH